MRVRYRNVFYVFELIYWGCVGFVWCILIIVVLFGFKIVVGFNVLGILMVDYVVFIKWFVELRIFFVVFFVECLCLYI